MNRKIPLKELCIDDEWGKYGIPASAEEYDNDKTRYLRITDISEDGELLNNDKKSVSAPDIDKYLLKEGDIVFARTGNSTGKSYYHEDKNGKLAFAGFLIKYSLDKAKVNPKYVKFFTITNEYKNWVKNLSVGSTRGNINAQTFGDCPISVPERKQQDLLVRTLSLIIEKIELNNSINAELEAMAKTLYNYWFVQFDFPDKNGKPYKTSGGKMVWNEKLKREIPEEWEEGTLNNLGVIIGGSTPPRENEKYFSKNGTAWITPKDLSLNTGNKFITKGELDVTEEGIKASSLNVMPKGSILLSSRAPIGYLAISRESVTTNQGFKSFVPNKGFSTEYVYYTIQSMIPTIENHGVGSTFREVSASTLKTIPISLADKNVAIAFSVIVKDIFERQNILEIENQKLTELRDWLLPMLMNGQVKVN